MRDKRFRRLVLHPRNIPGIHNYSDRWCERCPFTLRCSVYAVSTEMRAAQPPHERQAEGLWDRLQTAAPLAAEILRAHANHAGVGRAPDPIFRNHDRPLDTHRLGAAVKRYHEFAHRSVKEHGAMLEGRTDPGGVHAVTAAEAFEIIAWYHTLIPVKLSRALAHDELDDEMVADPELAQMPRDQDGSAKVALIGIDRSILAWAVLSLQEPALAQAARAAMVSLQRLRAAVEKELPEARVFVRPGLDTHRFPRDAQGG